MTDLGVEWVPDIDGVPYRKAARVVVFDADNRVLLLRGHDSHAPEHNWWFTVGGGMLDGEDPRECALRELKEETGIVLKLADLVGPVLYRESEFRFSNVTARQDELFFTAHLNARNISVRSADLSDLELLVLDEFRWFTFEELDEVSKVTNVYPQQLPILVRKWAEGWDGSIPTIIEGSR